MTAIIVQCRTTETEIGIAATNGTGSDLTVTGNVGKTAGNKAETDIVTMDGSDGETGEE